MKITHYFIKHPVIALILNAMILIIGALCFNTLSLREYPEIQFPDVSVQTQYPNASAELVETSVTYILEDQLAGIEGIDSIVSDSKNGISVINISFKNGTSIDRAMIAIREAIGLARNQLPQVVKDPIIERKTVSSGMPFIVLSLESSSMDFAALTHYANINLKNAFRGIKGVSSVEIWGQPYTYEITLNPLKMYAFGVNADEVFDALQRNNVSLPVGKFQNEIPSTLNVELKNSTDYENLVIKEKNSSDPRHKQNPVLLKNIADIALKTDNERFRVRINGKPGLAIAINRTNDGNPLDVSTLVRAQLKALKSNLPQGLTINIIADQADFVRSSLSNIKSSIFEAIVFVLIIVFLFLRNMKATLIPLVTIPISLMGSFIFLKLFGFSINIITLMAMVLAVGLVVDDAIVMLENIQRHIDAGLLPYSAALKGSKEIGFAIVAMTLTLTSVYAPLAFISGTVGQLFTEFAVALAGSVFISGIVALTLSPLMCTRALTKNDMPIWPTIDRFLQTLAQRYRHALTITIHYSKSCIIVILSLFACIFLLTKLIPSEMAPKEDRSLIGVFLPPIPGKDINTMEEKIKSVENIVQSVQEAQNTLIFMGDWGGNVVLPLKPQAMRTRSASEIVDAIKPLVTTIPSVDVYPWSWDSGLPGLDDSMTGSELSLTISTTDSYRQLFEQVEKM
jgi:multidrug efflux pump